MLGLVVTPQELPGGSSLLSSLYPKSSLCLPMSALQCLLPCPGFPSPFPWGFSIHCSQTLFSMSLEWDSLLLVSIFFWAVLLVYTQNYKSGHLQGLGLLEHLFSNASGVNIVTLCAPALVPLFWTEKNSRLCCKMSIFLLLRLTTISHDFFLLSLCAVAFSHLSTEELLQRI